MPKDTISKKVLAVLASAKPGALLLLHDRYGGISMRVYQSHIDCHAYCGWGVTAEANYMSDRSSMAIISIKDVKILKQGADPVVQPVEECHE